METPVANYNRRESQEELKSRNFIYVYTDSTVCLKGIILYNFEYSGAVFCDYIKKSIKIVVNYSEHSHKFIREIESNCQSKVIHKNSSWFLL